MWRNKMVSTAKLSSLGVLFVMSCVSGLAVPYIILRVLARNCRSSRSFKRVLGVLNCFSGGVFISTTLLTLLPEGRETVENAYEILGHEMEYPVTELILGFGFLLILTIENVTISCYTKCKKGNEAPEDSQRNDETGIDANQTSMDIENKHKCNEFCASYQNGHVTVISVRQEAAEPTVIHEISPDTETVAKHSSDAKHSDHCLTDNIYGEGMSNLHSIVLLLALSIHMIFDGLSLGLLDEENEVWSLLLALGIHKILIFFSTGITICESTTTVKFVVAMIYMSFVSPIGVGIGILLTSQSTDVTLTIVSAFLQAVAVGTFMYVAFFEILLKEFSAGESGRIAKAVSTIIGYSIFAGLKYFMPE